MNLLEKVRNAKEGETIEIGRLTDCCKSMKELEDIAIEIKHKNIIITSNQQPWINSDVFGLLLGEIHKVRNKK